MDSTGRRFSFYRLVTNMIPNFANDSKDDVDLSPEQKDCLQRWQLEQPDPMLLNEKSFYMCGVTQNESFSKKVYKALVKNGVLPAQSATSTDSQPTVASVVDTSKITKHFANELRWISVHAQRKLIGLLFHWEEEIMRFILLNAEEAEIKKAMETRGENDQDLMIALQAVQKKRGLLPSQRNEATDQALPAYS